MGTIGDLAVTVTANTEKFSRNLKTARHDAGLFGSSIENVGHQIAHLAEGFAAGLTIHRFISDIESATEGMVELGHAASRLGASAEGMGALEHAGALVHLSNEDLIRDLTFMEKNLGKNSDAFSKLGLSVGDLKSMNADQALLKIAEALERLPSAADRTAAAIAIFGKGGAGILKLTNDVEGLKSAMEEAKGMGLARSEEDIKKIEEEDKAIQRLKESYKGLAMAAGVKIAPTVQHAAEAATFAMGGGSPQQRRVQELVDTIDKKTFDKMSKDLANGSGLTIDQKKDLMRANFGAEGANRENLQAIARRQNREDAAAKAEAEKSTSVMGGFSGGIDIGAAMGQQSFMQKNSGMALQQFQLGMGMMMGGALGQTADPFAGDEDLRTRADALEQKAKAVRMGSMTTEHGGQALEKGSAAAFTQAHKSSEQLQLLNEAKEQRKILLDQAASLRKLANSVGPWTPMATVNIP